MREYQKDFITLYGHLRKPENKTCKQGKPNFILQKLSLHNKQGICLDVGCSDGVIALSLSEQFDQVIGADIDMKALGMIEKTSRENVRFLSGDAMALPFEDQSMDTIICSQTYEHVPSSEKLFREIDRLIKKRGIILFSGPNKTFPIEPHYFLPFLHWFNQKSADIYLQLTGMGDHYYERSETYWKLKRVFQSYEIIDVIKLVFEYYGQYSPKTITRIINRVASKLPIVLLRILAPFMVNINWILIKKATGSNDKHRIKFAS
jgi:ubiquinone/menaquinone biosynthesis C-methylase UbiE